MKVEPGGDSPEQRESKTEDELFDPEEIDAEKAGGDQRLAPVGRVSEDHGEDVEEEMEVTGCKGLVQCCQVLLSLAKVASAVLTLKVPDSELPKEGEYCQQDKS